MPQNSSSVAPAFLSQPAWLQTLSQAQPVVAGLLSREPEEQRRLGYFHTLREICQQPATWLRTAESMAGNAGLLSPLIEGISSLVLTGSGSSEFAGDCARMVLQHELGINVQAIAAGALLTHGSRALPIGRPGLLISLARSGDSPESVGALSLLLKIESDFHHLVLTCNRQGGLATKFEGNPRVTVISLDDVTNDRSLVMTSSFTNLVLAARFLGLIDAPARYLSICHGLSHVAAALLQENFETIARVGRSPFQRVLFLGTGPRFAAAREAALKMLEMTAGRVTTSCETYLGLRHGPMSAVDERTLVVCFLSNDLTARAYESDLIRELSQKQLGLSCLLVGANAVQELAGAHDVAIQYQGASEFSDGDLPVVDAVVGQLLGFFRCLHEGLRPDSPSESGVISRVVPGFALHPPL